MARCLVHLGQPDAAFDLVERLHDRPDPMDFHLACTLARAGADTRALDTLEWVIDQGWKHGAWLDRDPDFDRLRDHPRFRRIVRAITQ